MNGGVNHFTSHFIIGCKEVNRKFTLTETNEIEALHKWIEFKDNDPHMTKYRTRNTQYISYLRIIPIEDFKEILEDLKTIYRKKYPYSEKKDFIKYHFEGTIFELKRIIENTFYFTWMSAPPNESKYTYYTYFSHDDRENIDFGILNDYDIDYYTQYYQKVIDLIENTTYNESKENPEPQTILDVINLTGEMQKTLLQNAGAKGETIEEMQLYLKSRELKIEKLNKESQNLENEYKTVNEILPDIFESTLLSLKEVENLIGRKRLECEEIYELSNHNLSVLHFDVLDYMCRCIEQNKDTEVECQKLSDYPYIDFENFGKEEIDVDKVILNYRKLGTFYVELLNYLIPIYIKSPLEVKSLCELIIKDLIKEIEGLQTFMNTEIYDYHCSEFMEILYTKLSKFIIQIKDKYCSELNINIPDISHTQTPFTNPKTHELFNYIVDNWDYRYGQKWADIWNEIDRLENYKAPYKNEYQNYIIQRFGYTGKFQYDKQKKDENRDRQRLLELIENFSKK